MATGSNIYEVIFRIHGLFSTEISGRGTVLI